MTVEKTTVYLPTALKERLARAAKRRGTSEAALIRQGVERVLAREAPRPTLPLFRSGDPTLSQRVDELLDAEFGLDGLERLGSGRPPGAKTSARGAPARR